MITFRRVTIASLVCVLLSISTELYPQESFEELLESAQKERVVQGVASLDFFLPAAVLSGSAEEIGLEVERIRDIIRLRLRNDVRDLRVGDPEDLANTRIDRLGLVAVTVWTVGDDYPIAYHTELEVGRIGDPFYEDAILGYAPAEEIEDIVEDNIEQLIRGFAIELLEAFEK